MNKLDKQYTDLLQDILDNGVTKQDRTGTGTLSVFGRQIRHKMSDGFPLLTTKKMAWKSIVTELLWFLRGDTHIKFLVDNNCHIWDGDAYKYYILKEGSKIGEYGVRPILLTIEEFINKIKTDGDFSKEWGLKIEERELSLEERTKYKKKRDGIVRTFASYTHQMLDGSNIPTKLITITYKNETIESYEN